MITSAAALEINQPKLSLLYKLLVVVVVACLLLFISLSHGTNNELN